MSKVTNLAPLRYRTLLSKSFTRLREAVLVPTLSGYLMFWPEIVMRVGWGRTFQGGRCKQLLRKQSPSISRGECSRIGWGGRCLCLLHAAWRGQLDQRQCLGTSVQAHWRKRCSSLGPAVGGGGARGAQDTGQSQGLGQRAQGGPLVAV